MCGFADDVHHLLRIIHIGNFHANGVRALTGHGGLGITGVGQSGAQNGDGALHQRIEVLHRRVLGHIDGRDTALQIQTQADCVAYRRDDVLANLNSVERQARNQNDQNGDDRNFDPAFDFHPDVLPACDGNRHFASIITVFYYNVIFENRQYLFAKYGVL